MEHAQLGITPYSYEVRTEDGSSLIAHPFFKEIAEGPKFEFGSEDLGIVSLNLVSIPLLTSFPVLFIPILIGHCGCSHQHNIRAALEAWAGYLTASRRRETRRCPAIRKFGGTGRR